MNPLLLMLRSELHGNLPRSLRMKLVPLVTAFGVLLAGLGSTPGWAAEQEGLALGIVYDTSGSMSEPVRDKSGGQSPKYIIANRALVAIARQIETFATNNSGRKVECGLFTFQGERAREAVHFGPFDAGALQNWARQFSRPNGNTPLGNALSTASRFVLTSPLKRKHVLVITDGLNTAGPKPEAVLPGIKEEASRKQTPVYVHFVAFDVDAKQFSVVKQLGATVVGAADENQLNAQLHSILQERILLEDEEPPKTK